MGLLHEKTPITEALVEYHALLTSRNGKHEIDQDEIFTDLMRRGVLLGWWGSLTRLQMEQMKQLMRSGPKPYTFRGFAYFVDSRNVATPTSVEPIHLGPAEAAVFEPLIAEAPRLVPREDLKQALKQVNLYPDHLKLDIYYLRGKIGHKPNHPLIITVRNQGYKFDPQV